MTIPYERRRAAKKLGLVFAGNGYVFPEDLESILAARNRAETAIERQIDDLGDKKTLGQIDEI